MGSPKGEEKGPVLKISLSQGGGNFSTLQCVSHLFQEKKEEEEAIKTNRYTLFGDADVEKGESSFRHSSFFSDKVTCLLSLFLQGGVVGGKGGGVGSSRRENPF